MHEHTLLALASGGCLTVGIIIGWLGRMLWDE